MPTPVEWAAVVGAASGVGAVVKSGVDRYLNRNVDQATADKIRADSKMVAQETASSEVNVLRDIISEVRSSEAAKSARIDALEDRLVKLEERERHALTRAAVHEAWDTLAFNFIAAHDPAFTPPPPLAVRQQHDHED